MLQSHILLDQNANQGVPVRCYSWRFVSELPRGTRAGDTSGAAAQGTGSWTLGVADIFKV